MSLVIDSDIWVAFLQSLQSKLSQESFNAWFQPLRFEGLDTSERLLKLRAPNPVIRDWVNTNYSSVVDESFDELKLEGYLIGWSVDKASGVPANIAEKQTTAASLEPERLDSATGPISPENQQSQATAAA